MFPSKIKVPFSDLTERTGITVNIFAVKAYSAEYFVFQNAAVKAQYMWKYIVLKFLIRESAYFKPHPLLTEVFNCPPTA